MFLSGSFYNQVALNGHIEASVGRLFGYPWLQRLKPPSSFGFFRSHPVASAPQAASIFIWPMRYSQDTKTNSITLK
jgi:hypothetical protein